MSLLLDTHVLLWWLSDAPALNDEARDAIGDAATIVYVSAASAWEISIKKALGKLDSPDDLQSALVANHFFLGSSLLLFVAGLAGCWERARVSPS